MTRFTKAVRQKIVRDFAERHGGVFTPAEFVQEVRAQGKKHPAYDWFEWNKDKAAFAHQVHQAREFARDLTVTFKVEAVGRTKALAVKTAQMPMVQAPMRWRGKGGGYRLTRPENPAHMDEHRLQAAINLRSWLNRFEAAILAAGIQPAEIDALIGRLEGAPAKKAA